MGSSWRILHIPASRYICIPNTLESGQKSTGIFKTKKAASSACNSMHDLHYYFSYIEDTEQYTFDMKIGEETQFKQEEFTVVKVDDG